MSKEKIVLDTDPDIVEYRTDIKGWVGKDGRFYGKDEHLARYANSTHKKCEKGHIHRKGYCRFCREEETPERYKALKFKEWDGKTPLILFDDEKFFWDEGDIEDYMVDNDIENAADLMLVICEPQYLSEIEESWFEDVLPEDWVIKDVDKEVAQKLEELNQAIRKSKPASWTEGKYRTKIDLKLK